MTSVLSAARLAVVTRVLLGLGGLLFAHAAASPRWFAAEIHYWGSKPSAWPDYTATFRIALDDREECLIGPPDLTVICFDPEERAPSCMTWRISRFAAVAGTLTIGACFLLVAITVVLLTGITPRWVRWWHLAVAITLVATPGLLFIWDVNENAPPINLDDGADCYLIGLLALGLALAVTRLHAARAHQDARLATAVVLRSARRPTGN